MKLIFKKRNILKIGGTRGSLPKSGTVPLKSGRVVTSIVSVSNFICCAFPHFVCQLKLA